MANNSVAALQNGFAATGVVLELFDVSGTTRLATSNSNTLSLAGIAGGRYALRVSSANPVESYSLSFNAPNLPVAATLPNRTADKATNWGVMARNSFVNGSVAASSATSWTFYQFETPRTATLQSLQLTLNVATGVAMDVEIVDAAGRVVSSASNATSNNSALTLNLQPQTASQSFTMRVRQSPSRTAATPAVFNMFVA